MRTASVLRNHKRWAELMGPGHRMSGARQVSARRAVEQMMFVFFLVLAEVNLDDLGIVLHFLHRTLAKQAAFVQHGDFAGALADVGRRRLAADAQAGDVLSSRPRDFASRTIGGVDDYFGGRGPQFSCDDVQQSSFPSAIWSDDHAQFSPLDGEIELVERLDT